MLKNLFKKDLRDGVICKLRDGENYILLDNKLIGYDTYINIDYYKQDLSHKEYNYLDIMEVYVSTKGGFNSMMNLEHCIIVWKRNKIKEFTVQELELMLGYPIKIVTNKSESTAKDFVENNLNNAHNLLYNILCHIPKEMNEEYPLGDLYSSMASLIESLEELGYRGE